MFEIVKGVEAIASLAFRLANYIITDGIKGDRRKELDRRKRFADPFSHADKIWWHGGAMLSTLR